MAIAFNFNFLDKSFLNEFKTWVEKNDVRKLANVDGYLYSIERDLNSLHLPLDDEQFLKGIVIEVRSTRVIETVKAIAREILRDTPSKLAKVASMKIWYGYNSQCLFDKDGNLGVKICPHEIVNGGAALLEQTLWKNPTLLNFTIGHEIAHYKFNDGPQQAIERIVECIKVLQYRLAKKSPKKIKAALNRLDRQSSVLNQKLELRADTESLRILGCASQCIKQFSGRDKNNYSFRTHPTNQERRRNAEKFLHIPCFIPSIQISLFEHILEFCKYNKPMIGII